MVIISNTGLFKKKNEGSKVGLFLKKPESNFSNGCVQQAIFIRELLEKAGYACEYLSIEPKFTKIDDIAQPDVKVVFDYMELSSYKLLIFVSLNLVSPENDNFINMIKRSKSKCVNLICGNVFILHQEELVFNTPNIFSKFVNNLYDEYWVLEMYPFAVEYIRLMTNKYICCNSKYFPQCLHVFLGLPLQCVSWYLNGFLLNTSLHVAHSYTSFISINTKPKAPRRTTQGSTRHHWNRPVITTHGRGKPS